MTLRIFAVLCGLAVVGLPASAPRALAQRVLQPTGGAALTEGGKLVFLSDKRPVLLQLNINVDGQPIDQTWNGYIKKWFDYLDRDGDGKLSAQELRFAPRAEVMLQLMRQPQGLFFVNPNANANLRMADLGKNDDAQVELADFQRYYQKQRVGAVQVTVNQTAANFTSPVSDTLFKLLDQDKDGKLSKQELLEADKILARLDGDDDEMVTAQEIVPNPNVALGRVLPVPAAPQRPASPRIGASFYTPAVDADSGLALLLLSHYDTDKNRTLSRTEIGLSKETFAALDTNKDGELDAEELARWHLRAADLAFTVNLGKTGNGHVVELHKGAERKFAEAVTPSAQGQLLSLGDAQIQLHRDNSGGIRFAPVNQLMLIFRQVDAKNQGFIEMKDLQANRQFQFLAQMFPLIDRDGDGKMTLKEVQAFADLQSSGGNSIASVTITEHGRNLFQLLDANGDGRLSLRELKSAWSRLKSRDVDGDGFIELSELTRQFQVSVDRGGQQFVRAPAAAAFNVSAPRPSYPRYTPLWFQRMDRNSDGDVSFREFLGTREEFNRIDTDGDGLISPEEAIRYEESLRARK